MLEQLELLRPQFLQDMLECIKYIYYGAKGLPEEGIGQITSKSCVRNYYVNLPFGLVASHGAWKRVVIQSAG